MATSTAGGESANGRPNATAVNQQNYWCYLGIFRYVYLPSSTVVFTLALQARLNAG